MNDEPDTRPNYGSFGGGRIPQQPGREPCSAAVHVNKLFYFLCLLSGQFIIKMKRQCNWRTFLILIIGFTGLTFFLLQFCANLLSVAFNCYVVLFCPYSNCSYFYNNATSTSNGSSGADDELLTTNSLTHSLTDTAPVHINWNNAVITCATFAGWISYLMMTFLILLPINSDLQSCFHYFTRNDNNSCNAFLKIFCTTLRRAFREEEIFSPFDDTDNDFSSTKFKPAQAVYFYFIYIFNLVLYFTNLGLLSVIMHNRISTNDLVQYYLDSSGLIFQMSSQFCAIQSCFIFSKVAYMVSTQLEQLVNEFNKVNIADADITLIQNPENELHKFTNDEIIEELGEGGDRDKARYFLLQRIDQEFLRRLKASLDPYGIWFSIHWLLYTLTTLLSCALFAEKAVQIFYHHSIPLTKIRSKDIFDISYIVFFTLGHLLLFLYPCFRAASITVARNRLIQQVSAQQWKHIPLSVQGHFIQYLKSRDFSFTVSIFCADISFNFSTAYISLFVGIFGGILKLTI